MNGSTDTIIVDNIAELAAGSTVEIDVYLKMPAAAGSVTPTVDITTYW